MSAETNLLGRLAVHYKLLTPEQLAETTLAQARQAHPVPLGELWIDAGWMTRAQLDKLLAVQREVLAKQAGSAPPVATPPAAVAEDLDQTAVGQVSTRVGKRIDRILGYAVAQRASDVHILTAERVLLRADGELRYAGEAPLDGAQVARLVDEVLDDGLRQRLARDGQVDFAWTTEGKARFRGNAYRHQNGLGLVLRTIPIEIPTLGSLNLPNSLAKLTNHHQGLVLLTGPSGCGKSATLAALLRLINEERQDHIVTIEDPIEYLHSSLLSVVNQRQVGRDTGSFARALKAALREDPDVIAIGELRDLETIQLALTAAETGHLVLATLHTGGAIRTVDRIVGSFPSNQQSQIRTMLSESLRAVVSQRLVRRADGQGRVPALEILLGTRAVANMVREAKTFQLRSLLQTAASQGMCLLDASLAQLVRDGLVTRDEAALHAEDPKLLPAA
ncbi:MAG TPA: type IV pilus twitching motility protein PilT [Burkholderiales bacterium]|nr:type IV pilus twitching motility protein PilT [Burkholderiales bacterium]